MLDDIGQNLSVSDRKVVLDLVALLEQRITDTIADKILDKVSARIQEENNKLVQRLESEVAYLNSITYNISNMKFLGAPMGAIFLQRAIKQMEKINVEKGKK